MSRSVLPGHEGRAAPRSHRHSSSACINPHTRCPRLLQYLHSLHATASAPPLTDRPLAISLVEIAISRGELAISRGELGGLHRTQRLRRLGAHLDAMARAPRAHADHSKECAPPAQRYGWRVPATWTEARAADAHEFDVVSRGGLGVRAALASVQHAFARAGPARAGPARAGRARAGPARAGRARAGASDRPQVIIADESPAHEERILGEESEDLARCDLG